MKWSKAVFSIIMIIAMMVTLSLPANAQDRSRRIAPAFPIGVGEEMVVLSAWGTGVIQGGAALSTTIVTVNGGIVRTYPLSLPVGAVLKRVLGDFVDQDGTRNLSIRVYRSSNSDGATQVNLRTFDTSSITSSSSTDAKQVVGNPMTHTILQGWTYYIEISWPAGASSGDLGVSNIKVIYEP